jgi:MFS transporter, putative metabolite:H+ symporter
MAVHMVQDVGVDGSKAFAAGQIAARIERLPITSWHIKARLLIGTATFFDAFDALAIAQTLPVIVPQWNLSSPQAGLLISISYVGQIVGALFFGWLAERRGRLQAIAMAILIFSLMSIACGLARNYNSLLLARAAQGIGLGGEVPIAAAYISEIAKAQGRGKFVLLYENVFAFGLVVSGFVGSLIVPTYGWNYLFFIGATPLVLIPLLLKMLPESPRWLASQGRMAEASAAVAQIEIQVERVTGKPLTAVSTAFAVETQQASWRDIVGRAAIRKTIVVWTLWFTGYLVYYGLGTWLPTLYRGVFHLSVAQSLRYGTFTQIAVFLGSLTCAFVIDWMGRRWLFVIALAGEGVSLLLLRLLGAESLVHVVVFTTIAVFFAGAAGIGAYLYTPEVYPTRSRVIATALGSSWLRLASMLGPVIVGLMVGHGINTVILLFSIVPLIASGVVGAFAAETAGRSLEEINGLQSVEARSATHQPATVIGE